MDFGGSPVRQRSTASFIFVRGTRGMRQTDKTQQSGPRDLLWLRLCPLPSPSLRPLWRFHADCGGRSVCLTPSPLMPTHLLIQGPLQQMLIKQQIYSLEGLMPKLKLQYSGHLMRKADHWKRPRCWERLKTGGEGDHRG